MIFQYDSYLLIHEKSQKRHLKILTLTKISQKNLYDQYTLAHIFHNQDQIAELNKVDDRDIVGPFINELDISF